MKRHGMGTMLAAAALLTLMASPSPALAQGGRQGQTEHQQMRQQQADHMARMHERMGQMQERIERMQTQMREHMSQMQPAARHQMQDRYRSMHEACVALGATTREMRRLMDRAQMMEHDPELGADPEMRREMERFREGVGAMIEEMEDAVRAMERLQERVREHQPGG